MHTHMYVHVRVCIRLHMHAHSCVHIHICYMFTCAHAHICTHSYMYTFMYPRDNILELVLEPFTCIYVDEHMHKYVFMRTSWIMWFKMFIHLDVMCSCSHLSTRRDKVVERYDVRHGVDFSHSLQEAETLQVNISDVRVSFIVCMHEWG